MTSKKLLRAFIAGLTFPAVFLPLAYTVLYWMEYPSMRTHALQFLPMYIPLLFGIANAVRTHMAEGTTNSLSNRSFWLTGICLGFVVAVLGVFILRVPTMIFGDIHGYQYLPLLVLPFIYGVIFRYVVKLLNKVVSV